MQSRGVVTGQPGPRECLSVARIVGRVGDSEVSPAPVVGRYTRVGRARNLIREDSATVPMNPRPTSEGSGIGINTICTDVRILWAAAPHPHPMADL